MTSPSTMPSEDLPGLSPAPAQGWGLLLVAGGFVGLGLTVALWQAHAWVVAGQGVLLGAVVVTLLVALVGAVVSVRQASLNPWRAALAGDGPSQDPAQEVEQRLLRLPLARRSFVAQHLLAWVGGEVVAAHQVAVAQVLLRYGATVQGKVAWSVSSSDTPTKGWLCPMYSAALTSLPLLRLFLGRGGQLFQPVAGMENTPFEHWLGWANPGLKSSRETLGPIVQHLMFDPMSPAQRETHQKHLVSTLWHLDLHSASQHGLLELALTLGLNPWAYAWDGKGFRDHLKQTQGTARLTPSKAAHLAEVLDRSEAKHLAIGLRKSMGEAQRSSRRPRL